MLTVVKLVQGIAKYPGNSITSRVEPMELSLDSVQI